ncbi:MAG: tetratricopeptide repeat protein [Sphingobacteriaceae bacterium]|nr:tetratricopeptide repeat protein [Sphingobacteriaceae bacterium]
MQANYNIGAIYLDVKSDHPKAIEYLTKALEQDNQWAAAYFARGYAYSKMGNKLNAAQDYKKCLAIEPNFTEATVGLRELN